MRKLFAAAALFVALFGSVDASAADSFSARMLSRIRTKMLASNIFAPANVGAATGTLSAANGGTGSTTLTAHGFLVGEGTGAVVGITACTSGQLAIGQGSSSDPACTTVGTDATLSSAGALTVTQISGSSPVNITTAGTLQWSKGVASPQFGQAAQTTDAAPPSITIVPSGPFASASTNLVPGSLIINMPSPVSGNTYGAFKYQQNSNNLIWMQAFPGTPTIGGLWFGGSTPSTTNYGLLFQSGNTQMNVASGGTLNFNVANVGVASMTGSAITLSQPVTSSLAFTATTTAALTGAITHPSPQTIACGTGGTQTVASSPSSGLIVTSGTLGSNCIIDFGTNATSGEFTLDMSGVTLGATFGVQFKNGSASSSVITSGNVLSGDTLAKVWTHGANTLAVTY